MFRIAYALCPSIRRGSDEAENGSRPIQRRDGEAIWRIRRSPVAKVHRRRAGDQPADTILRDGPPRARCGNRRTYPEPHAYRRRAHRIGVAVAVVACLALTACGGGESADTDVTAPSQVAVAPAAPIPAPAQQPAYTIQAGAYNLIGPMFNAGMVVEASYYAIGQSFGLFFGCADSQTCLIPDYQATPQQSAGKPVFPDTCRFPYVFGYQGATYLACGNNQPGDGDIYLYRSTDLINWAIQNNGQPILRRQPGTKWAHVWNVAILPVGNRWHMLAESNDTLDHMNIAYAWADPAVSMDFTPNQGPVVIPNGGNPEMFLKDGKMVAVHGLFRDRSASDPWYTTMSIADPASPTVWTVRRDKLLIEQPGIDVCDPTYIEINGQGRIAVSYDQNKVLELVGPPLTIN